MTFAKIVTATDGAQVLFFKDIGDDGPELAQVTAFDGLTARCGMGFTDDDEGYDLRDKAFDKADLDAADLVRKMFADMLAKAPQGDQP